MTIPPCPYRSDHDDKHAVCLHPRVHAALCVVPLKLCARCTRHADTVEPKTCGGHAGLGDTLAAFFAALGVRPWKGCGCKRRQAALNRLVPYSWATWRRRLGVD